MAGPSNVLVLTACRLGDAIFKSSALSGFSGATLKCTGNVAEI